MITLARNIAKHAVSGFIILSYRKSHAQGSLRKRGNNNSGEKSNNNNKQTQKQGGGSFLAPAVQRQARRGMSAMSAILSLLFAYSDTDMH